MAVTLLTYIIEWRRRRDFFYGNRGQYIYLGYLSRLEITIVSMAYAPSVYWKSPAPRAMWTQNRPSTAGHLAYGQL